MLLGTRLGWQGQETPFRRADLLSEVDQYGRSMEYRLGPDPDPLQSIYATSRIVAVCRNFMENGVGLLDVVCHSLASRQSFRQLKACLLSHPNFQHDGIGCLLQAQGSEVSISICHYLTSAAKSAREQGEMIGMSRTRTILYMSLSGFCRSGFAVTS